MTRSTESESVSIARYELWNARRESLLSQNWTASEEEDTNASLNTEEENMNTLLFNHEMIKISISTELNAWISTHEADDLVAFIKYMCQQHDIKIETHNDMIYVEWCQQDQHQVESYADNVECCSNASTERNEEKERDYTSFRSNIKSTKHFDFERSILEVDQAI